MAEKLVMPRVLRSSRDGLPMRELTQAERDYVLSRDRTARMFGRIIGFFGLLVCAGLDIGQVGLRQTSATIWALVAGNLLLLALAGIALNEGLRRSPVVTGQKPWPAVGCHGGVHLLAGKPVSHQLGQVVVVLPDRWTGPPLFGLGQYAAVELVPALEEDPDPRHPRMVLSAVDAEGRRVRAVDPALVGTSAI